MSAYTCPKCGTSQGSAGALLSHVGGRECVQIMLRAAALDEAAEPVAFGGTVHSLDGKWVGELIMLDATPSPSGKQRNAATPRHGPGVYLRVSDVFGHIAAYCGTEAEVRAYFPERDIIDRLARRQRGGGTDSGVGAPAQPEEAHK